MSTNYNGIIFDDEQPSGGNNGGIIFDDDPVASRIPQESVSTLKNLGILDEDGNVAPLSDDAREKMNYNIYESEKRAATKWAGDNNKDGVWGSMSPEERVTTPDLVARGLESIEYRAKGDIDSARARALSSLQERLANEEDFDPMSIDGIMYEMEKDYKDMSPAAREFLIREAVLKDVGGDLEKYEKEFLPSLTPEQRNEEAIRVRNIVAWGNQSKEEQLSSGEMGPLEKVQNDLQAKYGVKASKGYSAAVASTPFADTAIAVADMFITEDLEKLMKGDFNLDEVLNSGKFDSFKEAYDSGEWSRTKTRNMIKLVAYESLRSKAENQGEAIAERERRGVSTWGHIGAGGMKVFALGGEFLTPFGPAGKGATVGTKVATVAAQSAAPLASSAARRYANLRTNDYSFNENGNLYVSEEADSVGDATVKSIVGAVAEVTIEKVGGKFLGKIFGATVGKAASSKVGQAVANNSVVRGVGKVVNFAKTPLKALGWNGIPGEVGEEFLDGATDAFLGLDTTESRKEGTTAVGRFKEFAGDFFEGENLVELAESMLLMQAVGGGSAYLQQRYSSKQLNKIITTRIGGVSENVLKKLSPEEKARIIEAHYSGLSADEAADIINKGAGALDKFMVEKQTEATKSADGRAMLAEMNPEAANAIRAARREGRDISRKMIRDLGLSEKVLGDVESRNKFGDALLEDGRKLAAKNAAKMDGQHEMALRQEIAGFVGDTSEAQRVYDRIVMKLKDASVLDDPYQREQLVMQAAEAVYAEDQARRVGGARQKARMAEKADHEARLAEVEARAAEQTQRAVNEAQERTNAEMMARETKRYNDFMLAREEARAKGGLNEARTNETQQKPEQAQSVAPPTGEAARPMEAGKAPPEVGGEVAATQPAVGASTSASAETKANTPPITAESAKGGSQAADAASTPMKPKTVHEGKAFVNSNIGKRYTDGKKTYEITGLTKDGEVSVKVTDKIGKSSETTLKLSGTLTNIFGTNKKSAVWSEVKTTENEQKSPNRIKTTADDVARLADETVPTYLKAMESSHSGGNIGEDYKIESNFANEVLKMVKGMSESELGEVSASLRKALYAKGNPMPGGYKPLLDAASYALDAARAGKDSVRLPMPEHLRARVKTTAKTPKTKQKVPKTEVAGKKPASVEAKAEPKKEAKVEPKSESAPSITPAEAMKKLGTLGAADVDTLTKAMHREERLGHTERANMIRVLRDYKRGVGTNPNPQSDETSGGKYRASVEAAKPLDDPAFVAWAKKRGVAPTTQKRDEYDKAMADTLTNRLSRWIKGVSVKTVNFIAPEEGGDLRAAKKITPAVTEDAAYLDAVKRGDMKTAERMVREAAAKAMPDTKVVGKDGLPLVVYHTSDWNPLSESDGNAVFDNKKIKEGSLGRVFYFSREQEGQYGKNTTKAYLNLKNPFNVDKDAGRVLSEKESERFYKALDGEVLGEYKTETMGELFAAFKDESTFPNAMRAIGYDGIVDEGRGYFGAFDSNQIKSVEITSKGDGSVIPLSQRLNPEDSDIRYLHDGERIVGSYNRATGEVKLAKGASVETVLHELGWHAARHWAEVNADSDPKAKALLEQMKKYAESAPKEIKDAVRDTYGEMSADTLLDEIGAARFTKEQSGRIAEALATKEGAAWYQKVWNKVVDFFKNFLTKIGYNRVDLGGIENMSPEVFGDFLADVMMSGKQLGERTAFSMEAPKGLLAKWTTSHFDYKAPIAELEKRTTGSSNNIYYLARTLEGMAQRGKNRAERAIKRVEKILGEDISPELLAQYMQLKAYEERNAKIERRNGKADASGMTPEDAKAIEKTIKDSGVDEAIFEEAAQILWDLQKEGLQARVDAGLLDQETANKWMTDEPHHIPWKDAVDPDSGEYVGRRMGASEFDTAEGRKTAASGDPITWMLQEYQDAMTRAAQNRLRSAIANLTRLNGDVGTIYDGIQTDSKGKRSFIKYPKDGGKAKVLSIPEGVKIESTVKNDGGMKNVLTFKEGGETKYLVLNGTLGEAVAGAVTGRILARPIPYLGAWNRFSSATATTFSWAFAAKNYKRDTVDVRNNFIADFGWKKGNMLVASAEKFAWTHIKELSRYAATGELSLDEKGNPITEFAKLVLEYEDAGGLMSGNAVQSYDHIEKQIKADFRFGKNRVRSLAKGAADLYMAVPKTSELLTRIGAFAALRKDGMSAKDAAMWARESTFDFDKKGAFAPVLNSLWLFSNANIQAAHRQLRGLIKSKNGWKVAADMAVVGFVMHIVNEMLNAGTDDDDEKEGLGIDKDISEYDRQHYIFLRFGQKMYRAPVNLGPYGFARYIGDVTARMMTGDISIGEAAKNLGVSAAEISATFSGVPINMGAVIQTGFPSQTQWIVQMRSGKNFAGFDLYKNKHPKNKTPDSHYGKRTTAPAYKWVAEKLNEITGGNEAKPGWFDIRPETVELVVENIGKSALRDITDLSRIPKAFLIDDKDIDGNESRYWNAKAVYDQDKHELENRSSLKGDERRAYLKERPWLYSAGKPGVTRIDNIVKRIEKLRDIEESDRATDERKAEAKATRRKLQARVIEIMKGK